MSDNQEPTPQPMPSWIDKALIQRALRNDGQEDAEVAEISVQLATAAGDNYGSTIYRVRAALADGAARSFVIKGPVMGAKMAEGVKESGIFKREGIMLAEVVPKMQAILDEAVPGRYSAMAPRCPLHGDDPEEFIVMEDLSASGFRLADRKRGLGLRHSVLALRVLARFHAASHALLRRQPELSERLDNLWRFLKRREPAMEYMFEGSVQTAADAIRTWDGFEHYAELLDKFKVGFIERLVDILEPRPGGFHVICHRDFWVNNMMFRYEDGWPSEIRLIDLQLSHVASPAIDLLYFLSGSTSEHVHMHHQELLLREYHHELTEVLSLLGLQALSFEDLQEELHRHGPLALFVALCSLPIMRSQEAADFESILQGDNSKATAPLQQPVVKRWLQRVIPDYAQRGWIRV